MMLYRFFIQYILYISCVYFSDMAKQLPIGSVKNECPLGLFKGILNYIHFFFPKLLLAVH